MTGTEILCGDVFSVEADFNTMLKENLEEEEDMFNKKIQKMFESYVDLSSIPDTEFKRPRQATFPMKLHRLLHDSINYFSHIISWSHHGRSFEIRDENAFLIEILPKYFKQTKILSFYRQLSTYGFQKISRIKNNNIRVYFHELFLRGRPNLCHGIKRQKKRKFILRPECEPDFILYSSMP